MINGAHAFIAAFLLPLAVTSCTASSSVHQPELPMKPACFVGSGEPVPVLLEVARIPEERQKGLMGRQHLPKHQGMLFVYPTTQRPDRGFWMHNTLLELDIAYIDRAGTIGSIIRMTPCTAPAAADCPTYPAGVPFIYAVEMNAGFYSDNDVSVGDKLMVGAENCEARNPL